MILTKKTVWKYFVKSENILFYKIIEPGQNITDIISILETSSNNQFNNKKVFDKSVFYKIIKGQRLSAYGWYLHFIYL